MLHRVSVATVAGLVVGAQAQVDPGAFWPGYKRGNDRSAAAVVDAAPSVVLDATWTTVQPPSMGGLTVGSDGNIYFKTRTGDGSLPRVYKIDPSDGSVLAQSPPLDGDAGSYAGLSHGTNFLWTAVTSTASGSRVSKIVKLNYADLSIADEFTSPAFDTPNALSGLRGEPVIGSVPNQRGNVNLYVHARGVTGGPTPGGVILCVDSVTGDVDWSYDPMIPLSTFFGRVGPVWESGGRMHIAYFGNDTTAAGVVIRDNADGTFTEMWMGGPNGANWFGSGAMNAAGDTIYVTSHDGGTDALWAIDATTGAVDWSVPGMDGTIHELDFFARPAVMGDRVYCGGAYGVVACFEDDGAGGFTTAWSVRPSPAPNANDPDLFVAEADTRAAWLTEDDFLNSGQISALTVVEADLAGTPTRFVYAVMEQQPQEDGAGDPFTAQLIVIRDDGAAGEVLLRSTLGDTMKPTAWGSASPTVDADGTLYVVGGNASSTGAAPGEIYRFVPEADCPADRNGDGVVDFFDVQNFLNAFATQNPTADINDDGVWDFFDVQAYLNLFSAGCP